ncbi:nicotinate (nicotinamide) nucleotide adenylyltransferase [Paraflavitalea pollutisoli]|uniref:nicotinate (nicotinamide) nucleotide adenylyltransferase n=1 Tax=Paraflavitalea pollutisoli TaxID=3034143 RepID=UPI0023EB6019|nr:nicotinate (nicotinamide) nucleotide adenylyltransferase [Paraflavitalea sp. H1-2-19X]
MKVGLYFGSFNPIHHGHLIIAQHVVQNTDLEQVWFVVSPQNPLKPSAGLLNEFHRLYLIQLSIEDTQHLKVTDIEFRLPRPSYTVDTLTYLREKYPQHEFAVIMGSDSFENLPRWKNYHHILDNYPLYIYKRPGHEVEDHYEGSRVSVLQAPLLEISATHIRNTIKAGKSIRYLVPDKVAEEIERNGYYKS